MEYFDLYTKDRIRTGKILERGKPIPKGYYRMVVHVCVFNYEGKLLIQQRQKMKKSWPNMWDMTAGGSAIAGESSTQAAEREFYEEIGYRINLNNKAPSITLYFSEGFNDIYILKQDIDLTKISLQNEEVRTVKWATKDEILNMIDKQSFIPYHKSLIELLFFMRDDFSGALTSWKTKN